MTAYFLFENKAVNDPAGLERYKDAVAEVVARYGGTYRVLGGEPARYEGDWFPAALVMIEFPSRSHAEDWYKSPDYERLKELRQASVSCNAVLMSGAP